jgi:hypothetical protein
MFRVDTTVSLFEEAAIARRKRQEQERKQRIFNPKIRTMGVMHE